MYLCPWIEALVVQVVEGGLEGLQSIDPRLSVGGCGAGGVKLNVGISELLSECGDGVLSDGKAFLFGDSGSSRRLKKVCCSSSSSTYCWKTHVKILCYVKRLTY